MSNRDGAERIIIHTAKIIHHMTGDLQRAHDVANELADAGLLAPDLPEPDECPPDIHKPGWRIGLFDAQCAAAFAGRVWITDSSGWGAPFRPEQVRAVAYKLLAAANYSEGNQE